MKTHILPSLSALILIGTTSGISGCTQSFSAGVHCNSAARNCTIGFGYTVSWANSCQLKKDCRKYGGMFQDFLARIGSWTETVLGIQKAYASEPGFDASQVRVDLSATNIAVTNDTGNFMVSLYSGSTLIAQQEFAYYRSGNSLYATDPGAINAWVAGYGEEYDSAQVSNVNNDVTYTSMTTAQTTATLTSTMVYEGTNMASGSTSFAIGGTTGGCTGKNCKQF